MKKSQKESVIDEVKDMYTHMGVPFVLGKTNALSGLPHSALETIKSRVADHIINGLVEYGKDATKTDEVRAYARSMVMNHLKKARELNGGVAYTPSNKRSSGDSVAKPKHSGIDKTLLPDSLRAFVEEKL